MVETTTLTRESAEMVVIIDTRSRIFAVAGSELVDGETFTIDDRANTPTVFEFDSNGSVTGGRVAVPFTGASTPAQVASAIRTAINSVGAGLSVDADTTIGHIVPLSQAVELPFTVSDTVANAGFTSFTFERTNYTVTLPEEPQAGDIVRLLPDGSAKHQRNLVVVQAGGAQINGSSNGEYVGGSYGAQSYTYGFNGGWITSAEALSNVYVTSNTTLQRTSRNQLVLVDSTSGPVQVVLPNAPLLGDRVTILKVVSSSNGVTVKGWSAFDTIDDRGTSVGTSIVSDLSSVTLVRTGRLRWVTLSETTNVIEITATFTMASVTSAKEIHVLVRTNDAAWALSTKEVFFPTGSQTRKGTVITISDVDGGAAANPIAITGGGVLGVSSATSGATYIIDSNHGSVSLINKSGTSYSILAESHGLADNFSGLQRADTRSDAPLARLRPSPLFNWSHRKVAIHAEFAGLITNFFPVDGFTAGGTMVLSKVPVSGLTGTVGVLRTTTTGLTSGYLHLGSLPTDTLFDPAQLLGFRAILTAQTVAPGVNYDVLVGFGEDISETAGSDDQKMGSNGLYAITTGSFWRSVRQASGSGSGVNSTGVGAVVAGNRYVIEYYGTAANGWSLYVNGTRFFAGTTNVPTAKLNFGMQVLNGAGGMDYVVDVDSFTIFTQDMGTTRYNP